MRAKGGGRIGDVGTISKNQRWERVVPGGTTSVESTGRLSPLRLLEGKGEEILLRV